MKRLLLLAALAPVALVMAAGLLVAPSLGSAVQTAYGGPAAPPAGAIPAAMLRLYAQAAATCPGLPWQILAAIGGVESDHGRSDRPGVRSGHNGAGAEGPMQFEPATFARYAEPVPPGGADPPSPYDPADAVYAAARLLCASGAADPARLGPAVFDYNHSGAYVAEVLARAGQLGWQREDRAGAGLVAVEYALRQVGTPYQWGGESPGVGFDCSGLAQAAWAAAGVALPRVAEDQLLSGPPVPAGPLAAGDLVFFGPAPGDATHVGIVVDAAGVMVDAPHSGATVRIEPFPVAVGAPWGSDLSGIDFENIYYYLGATDPGA